MLVEQMQSQHKQAKEKRKISKTLHRFKSWLQTLKIHKKINSFPTGFVFINIGHTAKSTSLFRSTKYTKFIDPYADTF